MQDDNLKIFVAKMFDGKLMLKNTFENFNILSKIYERFQVLHFLLFYVGSHGLSCDILPKTYC